MNIDFTSIAPIIDGIAQKLGIAAEHLWGVLVKQSYIDGVSGMIWTGIWIILSIFCGFLAKHYFIKSIKKDDDYKFTGGIFIFLTICFLLVAGAVFTDAIKMINNPEYYAFINILSQFKQ